MVQPPEQPVELSPTVMFRMFYYDLCKHARPFHWENRNTGERLPGTFPEDLDNPNSYLVPSARGTLARNYCEFIPELQGYNWGVLHGHVEAASQNWEIVVE